MHFVKVCALIYWQCQDVTSVRTKGVCVCVCWCGVFRAEMEENMHWVSHLLASLCLKAQIKSVSSFGKH